MPDGGDCAAVDEEVDAGDEAGVVGDEERGGGREFVGAALAAQGRDVFEHLHHRLLLELLAAHRGVDHAGRDRTDARAERPSATASRTTSRCTPRFAHA